MRACLAPASEAAVYVSCRTSEEQLFCCRKYIFKASMCTTTCEQVSFTASSTFLRLFSSDCRPGEVLTSATVTSSAKSSSPCASGIGATQLACVARMLHRWECWGGHFLGKGLPSGSSCGRYHFCTGPKLLAMGNDMDFHFPLCLRVKKQALCNAGPVCDLNEMHHTLVDWLQRRCRIWRKVCKFCLLK